MPRVKDEEIEPYSVEEVKQLFAAAAHGCGGTCTPKRAGCCPDRVKTRARH